MRDGLVRQPRLIGRRRPREPLSNYERNMQRILFPPRPTLGQQLRRAAYAIEEAWHRHVRNRELYRRLDSLRAPHQATCWPEQYTPEFAERGLQRLKEAVARREKAREDFRSP
ncbi:hypothetical protein [Streptomyces sp. NPDC037389]|uniref:hypothetical protein n=1 Tax=Streptomyces sp. NPDC037389 TaxID=3155369 RepID=UPI0033F095C6